jgi:hypothetical protein
MPLTGRAQPTIGCTPSPLVATENSRAPNRLARSAIATAGMPGLGQAPILSALMAPSSSE